VIKTATGCELPFGKDLPIPGQPEGPQVWRCAQ